MNKKRRKVKTAGVRKVQSRAEVKRKAYRREGHKPAYAPYMFDQSSESKRLTEHMLSVVSATDLAKAAESVYYAGIVASEKRAQRANRAVEIKAEKKIKEILRGELDVSMFKII